MTGRVTVLTPVDNTPVVELGRTTWRKQILPVGELDYDGRKLHFTPEYFRNLVAGFKDKAFDVVPLQLADDQNRHTNDPERTAGEIIGLDADDKGLYATVSATDRGAALLKEHPNLGVSVRVVEQFARGDGKTYPAALQHVLATWAPRITGMQPWQTVQCSLESDHVWDLSALTFAADGTATAPTTPNPASSGEDTTRKDGRMSELTTEEKAALALLPSILAKVGGDGSSAPPAAPTAPTGAALAGPTLQSVPAPQAPAAPVAPVAPAAQAPAEGAGDGAEFTPEELAAMAAVVPPAGDAVAPANAPMPIAASNTDQAVELAALQARQAADAVELANVRNELAEARWLREAEELTTKLGIPPAIVNLAAPLLRGTGNAVELAHGAPTEPVRASRELAGKTMREVLAAMAKTYGRLVDLSGPLGTALDTDQATADAAARTAFLTQVRATGFAQ